MERPCCSPPASCFRLPAFARPPRRRRPTSCSSSPTIPVATMWGSRAVATFRGSTAWISFLSWPARTRPRACAPRLAHGGRRRLCRARRPAKPAAPWSRPPYRQV